jgi:hypothetical protein
MEMIKVLLPRIMKNPLRRVGWSIPNPFFLAVQTSPTLPVDGTKAPKPVVPKRLGAGVEHEGRVYNANTVNASKMGEIGDVKLLV